MRASRSRLALASELATAPMKKFTVEPVPTPTIMSSFTYLSAASAAAFFCALASMRRRINQDARRQNRARLGILAPHMKTDAYLEKILAAKVYDVAIESPLEAA